VRIPRLPAVQRELKRNYKHFNDFGDMTTRAFEFNDEQVLTIITALGVLKDRIGQKAGWQQRKRLPTLRGRLADCITIGDETEADGVRKALAKTQKDIDSRIKRGEKIADLMNDIKRQTGVTDERLRDFDIAEG